MTGRRERRTARAAGAVRAVQATVHDGTGPAVILLHGQPGSALDWQRVVPHLAPGFTVVVPDRPGYGSTGGPATGFAGNAAAVVRLLDRLGVERAIVVGHSWAGGVALALAGAHPGRVRGLVLVSSVSPDEPIGWEDRLLAAPLAGELIAATAIGGVGLVLGSRRVQHLVRRRLEGRARDGVVALTRLTRTRTPVWRSFVVEQRALVEELGGLAEGLGAITVPTAVVHGEADHIVAVGAAERLHAAIPGSTRHVLADAGHLLPHDRPEDIVAAIGEVADRG